MRSPWTVTSSPVLTMTVQRRVGCGGAQAAGETRAADSAGEGHDRGHERNSAYQKRVAYTEGNVR